MSCKFDAKGVETATIIHRYILDCFNPAQSPLIIGICGAQGSGKSTVSSVVAARLQAEGLRTAILSLDDLYFPRAERAELARTVHPLLVTRGVPGTHDVALGLRIMDQLSRHKVVSLPRFDKGRDEPVPEAEWPDFAGPADIILFEGWCVGARPQPDAALVKPVNALESENDQDGRWRRYVNAMLETDYAKLFARIDKLILLAAPCFDVVSRWRYQQEEMLRETLPAADASRAHLLNAQGIERFVAHYERLTRFLLEEMPSRADMVLRLDAERRLIGAETRQKN